ncbi:hypothetical protein L8106_03362 [Lyngbya sp. PCC 8106]|nr:hypothetical protein L8106_03362 [Lyngbya sp. PCC 8106]
MGEQTINQGVKLTKSFSWKTDNSFLSLRETKN